MINILLDLDQTCISAESLDGDEPEFNYQNSKHLRKAQKYRYEDMDGYYMVFERPGLQEFLDFLFKNFNVSIWTAASKDYALFIIEKFILNGKPERKLDWVFFSYHCKISEKIKDDHSKDLRVLWENFNLPGFKEYNTYILDDNPEVYDSQTDKCIIAPPFEFKDKKSYHDNFLYFLKKQLKNVGNRIDVRELNKKITDSYEVDSD